MSVPHYLHPALSSAGYQLVETPDISQNQGWIVVDAEGAQWLCTSIDVGGPREWDAVQGVVEELASGRHRHVVGLHDVVTIADVSGPGAREGTDRNTTDATQHALIWMIGSAAQQLGEYRAQYQLDLEQISAVLVAAGRGLASLASLGLPTPDQWSLDDLIVQQDGRLQVCPGSISTEEETNAGEQLRRVARSGQDLLTDIPSDQRSPDLAHLLTATAFDETPVGAGTFAALCHELVTPADAGSWLLNAASSQEHNPCAEPPDDRDADVATTAGASRRTDAARYSELTQDWRTYVRSGVQSGERTKSHHRFRLGAPMWMSAPRTSAGGRHKAVRPEGGQQSKRRGLLATVGAGILVAGLGTHLLLGGSGTEPTAQATPPRVGAASTESPVPTLERAPQQQQGRGPVQGGTQEQATDQVVADPGAAAMDLTEERLRILQNLRSEQTTKSDSAATEQRLATVLVPASPAMKADLRLVADLVDSTAETEKVVAEARTARVLRNDGGTAVVEVSYDLVDPNAGRMAQSATLTLALVKDRWRVTAVTDVPATEPQL